MKTRKGFVSNSSSTSYVIIGKEFSTEALEELRPALEPLFPQELNKSVMDWYDTPINETFLAQIINVWQNEYPDCPVIAVEYGRDRYAVGYGEQGEGGYGLHSIPFTDALETLILLGISPTEACVYFGSIHD